MPNHLAKSTSPYLLQHADNPVAWYPWGQAAFDEAARDQKPILLSIGYATCHWCHVMAHESFEDQEIADFLNKHFVSIKVDREERPDVDRVYMSYVQAITGHGGWPLNVWLTPDRKPFFGGTYFPPRDAGGRRGFLSLLQAIANAWQTQRDQLVHEANRVLATLAHHTRNAAAPDSGQASESDLLEAGSKAFEDCFVHLHESYDEDNGGFGGAPKFPRASNLHFLTRAACIQGVDTEPGKRAVQMLTGTLSAMARGGIHDAVGGGFHRYSVDGGWLVPHFEKMLYDQAQIALNYLEAFQATGQDIYAHYARDIFTYVERDLRLPSGGYASAEDADSLDQSGRGHGGKAEGAFYVWEKAELDFLLGDISPMFCALFGVSPTGNVPSELDPHGELRGKNVLHQVRTLGEVAKEFDLSLAESNERIHECLQILLKARGDRPRPLRDEKILAAWNGLLLSAFSRGAVLLDDAGLLDRAHALATFIEKELIDSTNHALFRSFLGSRGDTLGFAEDYACVIQGMLDLYECGGESKWLLLAEKLQGSMDRQFWDEARGGYFASRSDDPHLVLRLKDDYDGAEPSANSVAASNLLRFAQLFLEEDDWRARGVRLIRSLEGQWTSHPQALPQLLCAVEYALSSPRQAVLAGTSESSELWAMRRALHKRIGPRRGILTAFSNRHESTLLTRIPALKGYQVGPSGSAAVFLCEDKTCLPPFTEVGALSAHLASGAGA